MQTVEYQRLLDRSWLELSIWPSASCDSLRGKWRTLAEFAGGLSCLLIVALSRRVADRTRLLLASAGHTRRSVVVGELDSLRA